MLHLARNLASTVIAVCMMFVSTATPKRALAQNASAGANAVSRDCVKRLVSAYPDVLSHSSEDSLYWRNGVVMPLGGLTIPKNSQVLTTQEWEGFLDKATLRDQLAQCYPQPQSNGANDSIEAPSRNFDPGRIRYEPFFRTMYGATEEEVGKHLAPVRWLANIPEAAKNLLVTTVNGVNGKLKAVSDELEALPPEYRPYLVEPAGTFKWRTIAGTNRQSNHSFGAAIDIAIKYSDYWHWKVSAEDQYPYKNRIPLAIVRIFEKHGFIWGGRWYHYDTMHFEYRPELLTKECGCNQP